MDLTLFYRDTSKFLWFIKYIFYNRTHSIILISVVLVSLTGCKIITLKDYQSNSPHLLLVAMYKGYTEVLCAVAHVYSVIINKKNVHKILKILKFGLKSKFDWLPSVLIVKSVWYIISFTYLSISNMENYEIVHNFLICLADFFMELVIGEFFLINVNYLLKLSSLKIEHSQFNLVSRNFHKILEEIEYVNDIFNRQMLFIMTTIILNLPIYCYFFINELLDKSLFSYKTATRIINILWLALLLFVIVTPIEFSRKEVRPDTNYCRRCSDHIFIVKLWHH